METFDDIGNGHKRLGPDYQKSSRSNGNGGSNCVEVRYADDWVDVRDSKDLTGPELHFTPEDWGAAITAITNDTLIERPDA